MGDKIFISFCFSILLVLSIAIVFNHKEDIFYEICHNISNCKYDKEFVLLKKINDKVFIINKTTRPTNDVNYINTVYSQNKNIIVKIPALIRSKILRENCNIIGKIFSHLKCDNSSYGTFNGLYLKTQLESINVTQVIKNIEIETDKGLKARYVFYLARFFESNNNLTLASELYKERVSMEGDANERFYAQYRFSLLQLVKNKDEITDDLKQNLLSAYYMDPYRKEPLYYLGRIARIQKKYGECLFYIRAAKYMEQPWEDALYVENDIYSWKIDEELAICLYYTGRTKDAKYYWKKLLKIIPESENRMLIVENLKSLE